ncbi:MAG TPA: hypothetical protein VHH12_06110 [Mycobacterium sp.]|nr:hypothetical protein [Mycobacterium sp.]
MNLKHTAAQAGVTAAAGLAALFFSSAIATAEPAPAPGTENTAAEEQPREEEKQADCGQWCEVIEAAKQLPPPDWSSVDYPKLADVSVPVSFGLGLPDVVPDITLAPPALALPGIGLPSVGAPQFQLPPPPPAPKFQLPPPPNVPFVPGI